jgi:hypothetical protein
MIYPIIVWHDNIFVRYGNTLFHQIVVIPMGINCAPFIEDFSYTALNLMAKLQNDSSD